MSNIQNFDFNADLTKSLLWQYNDAVNLQNIVNAQQEWFNKNYVDFQNNWFSDVFNLNTANMFGLLVWSIILGQSLITPFIEVDDAHIIGFTEENANFYDGNFFSPNGNNRYYSIETSRILLKIRNYQLISSGTLPETNRMLKEVFGNYGSVYVINHKNMSITYLFGFAIPDEIRYMLLNTNILPVPAGVDSQIIQYDEITFGFGAFNAGFDFSFGV